MKKLFFQFPENMSPQARNAILAATVYLVPSAIVSAYLIFQAVLAPSWQLWTAALSLVAIAAAAVAALILNRRGRFETGIWFLIIVSYIAALVIITAVSGMGLLVMVSATLLSSVVAVQTLQFRQAVMFITGVVVGVASLVLDAFITTQRISVPGFQNLSYFFVPIMMLLFGIVIFRQFRNYSLRTKIIVVLTAIVIVAVSVVAFMDDRNSRTALTSAAYDRLLGAASQTAIRLDDLITTNLNIVKTEAETTEELAAFLSPGAGGESVDAARIATILYSFAQRDPQSITSYALLNSKGVDVADTFAADIGTDKSNREYFQNPMKTGQPYVSPVILSPTRPGDADLYFSSPVHNAAGQIIGVLRFSYNIKSLQALVAQANGLSGAQSFAVLLDENHIRLAHGTSPDLVFKSIVPLDPALLANLQAAGRLPSGTAQELSTNLPDVETALLNMETQPVFFSASAALGGSSAATAVVKMKTQPWLLYFRQPQNVFVAPIETQTRTTLLVALVIILLAAGAAAGLAQVLVAPITHLTATAGKIAAGDLSVQAPIESEDEIGVLAKTFNAMTAQLNGLIDTLESRVAERTQSLELAAQVGRAVSQVRALDVMLKDAAEVIRSRFDLYYVQVYLVDPSFTNLVLQSGTGEVGAQLVERSHRLALNTNSINGRAAIEKRSIVVSDTAASPTFRPNPLLPDTRSEMAVPLLVGDKAVGVLDLQNVQAGTLNQDMLPAFEALAGQLAIAIQNANLLAETNQARAEVESQARRLVRSGWEDYLDAVHRPEQIGFAFTGDQVTSLTEAEQPESGTNRDVLAAPISVTGEKIGALVVEMEEQKRSAQAERLIFSVARQVSQQIENLRLLESAERYRFEAEQASRSLTREGWKNYTEANAAQGLSYIYDLKEVRPYNREQQAEEFGLSLPLNVRDEAVGKLTIQGLSTDDKESLDLANAVAERLGAHIESLRLSEQTQERAQREQALRQITSAVRGSTDPATILRTAVRELGTLLGRKTVIRLKTVGEAPASQPDRPTDLVGDSVANNGDETVPPADSLNAGGGDQ